MSDSATIQFHDKDGHLSAVFYTHWGGERLVESARGFVKEMRERRDGMEKRINPLDRLEADVMMVEFVRRVANDSFPGQPVTRTFRLIVEPWGTDYGHFVVKTDE